MWIERIDFAGFGSISGEKVEFRNDKMSLAIEPNEYGKSTMLAVIWSTLYGFSDKLLGANNNAEREARRPTAASGLPFIAGVDVRAKGRHLKIIRDFSDGAVQIIDLEKGNIDVTAEFAGPNGDDEVGERLTGMTRDLFFSSCIVGRHQLAAPLFQAANNMASLIRSISLLPISTNSASATIGIIEEVFNNFPYKNGKYKIDVVARDLEGRFNELSERVKRYEEDRRSMGLDGMRARQSDSQADLTEEQIRANDFFDLCLEAADIDSRLVQSLEMLLKVQDLKTEIERVEYLREFPISAVQHVEELWTRRHSRTVEYDVLYEELAPRIRELEAAENQISDRYGGLQGFTQEDAQALGALAVNLRSCVNDVTELKSQCEEELNRMRGNNIDPGEVASIKKAFEGFEPKDYDDARSYAALITSFQEGIADAERAIEKANAQIRDFEEQRKSKKPMF
ncbi:MAG TPA: AAA family ATPase, partial [Chroococcales cyanobacterium]